MNRKQHSWLLSVIALALALGRQPTAIASDTRLIHGRIYTSNPTSPWAEALAITGSRIDAIGTDSEVLHYRKAKTRVIDLKGHTVILGIVDSHVHVLLTMVAGKIVFGGRHSNKRPRCEKHGPRTDPSLAPRVASGGVLRIIQYSRSSPGQAIQKTPCLHQRATAMVKG